MVLTVVDRMGLLSVFHVSMVSDGKRIQEFTSSLRLTPGGIKFGRVIAKQKLITNGPYQYVRHPIYTALLLIFISTQLITSSWLVIAAIPLYQYITWQASKEEELLQNQFGEEYRKYKKHTGMILPKL